MKKYSYDERIATIKSSLESQVETCTKDDIEWLITELEIARQNHHDAEVRYFKMGHAAQYLAEQLEKHTGKDKIELLADAITTVSGGSE